VHAFRGLNFIISTLPLFMVLRSTVTKHSFAIYWGNHTFYSKYWNSSWCFSLI